MKKKVRKEIIQLRASLDAEGYKLSGWCRKHGFKITDLENMLRPDRQIGPRSKSMAILTQLRKDFGHGK